MNSVEDVKRKFSRDVCICDTTLTEGQLMPGTVFANVEKYKIASLLSDAGVSQIECGVPALGGDERVAVKHIANMGLDASIMAASRAAAKDVEMTVDCDADSISLSIPTSDVKIQHKFKRDRAWALQQITEAITLAKEHGLYVVCCAEDASRTDLMFLIEFAKTAKEAGANRLRYCDSMGKEEPYALYEKIQAITKIVGIDIEVFARNDFGMANAVTTAGIKGGAKFATTTIMGIGERAGITSLDEIVMTCQKLISKDTGVDPRKLRPLADYVSLVTGVPVSPLKPFLGSNCFSYEYGMHSDSVSNEDQNDEPYKPELVGLQRKVVIGRNIGSKVIIPLLSKRGVEITREDAERLMIMIRKATVFLHRSLTEDELFNLYEQMMNNSDPFDEKMIQ